jgi:hypothetical protein
MAVPVSYYASISELFMVYNVTKWLLLHTGSGFQWYRTYKWGYKTSGSPLRFMLTRSSLVECVSVLHGTGVYKASFFFIRPYMCSHVCQKILSTLLYFLSVFLSRRRGKYTTQTGYMSPYYLSKAYVTILSYCNAMGPYKKVNSFWNHR